MVFNGVFRSFSSFLRDIFYEVLLVNIWGDSIILIIIHNYTITLNTVFIIVSLLHQSVYLSVDDYEVQIKAEYVRNVCTYAC